MSTDVINETTETVENEFMDDEMTEAVKLLNLKSKINDINSITEGINSQQKQLLGDDTEFDFIDKNIENITEEEIKEMSDEELDKLLTDEDGVVVKFTIDFGEDTERFIKFKKDFLILRKQSLETIKKFDEEIATINAEIAESQEEFDKLINSYGNVSVFIRSKLDERLENTIDEDQKELIRKMIDSFDDSMSLNRLKAYCIKSHDIIPDYRSDKKSKYIFRRYQKVIETFGIKTNLVAFRDLERRFLDKEYHTRNNIFMFAVIHYIASWYNKHYTKADALFITQFTINLKNLFYNKFETEEEKNTFTHSIEEVIKIIG